MMSDVQMMHAELWGKLNRYREKVDSHIDTELDTHEFWWDLMEYGRAQYDLGLHQDSPNLRLDIKRLEAENSRLHETREDLLDKLSSQFEEIHKMYDKIGELRKVNNEQTLELNSQWYDAEKCLPWPNSSVIIEIDRDRKLSLVSAEFVMIAGEPRFVVTTGRLYIGSFDVIRWRYADE